MLDAPLKIPQSLKFLQQSIFLKNTLRQGIQDTPKRRGNLIPFLCFNKAHLIEGLRIGGNSGQSVFLDILARFLREFQQFTPGLAVLAGRFPGGSGSYDLIVPKFQRLAESRNQEKYYIRGTFTRENLDFSKDVMHYVDLGFRQISIEPVVGGDTYPYAIQESDLPRTYEE